jgi:hypothetical protein
MFLQPVAGDLLNRFLAIAIPRIQQSEPFDGGAYLGHRLALVKQITDIALRYASPSFGKAKTSPRTRGDMENCQNRESEPVGRHGSQEGCEAFSIRYQMLSWRLQQLSRDCFSHVD